MTFRDGLVRRGAHGEFFVSRFWTPSLTTTDPGTPYLPLETAAAPPAGGRIFRSLLGVGVSIIVGILLGIES